MTYSLDQVLLHLYFNAEVQRQKSRNFIKVTVKYGDKTTTIEKTSFGICSKDK